MDRFRIQGKDPCNHYEDLIPAVSSFIQEILESYTREEESHYGFVLSLDDLPGKPLIWVEHVPNRLRISERYVVDPEFLYKTEADEMRVDNAIMNLWIKCRNEGWLKFEGWPSFIPQDPPYEADEQPNT